MNVPLGKCRSFRGGAIRRPTCSKPRRSPQWGLGHGVERQARLCMSDAAQAASNRLKLKDVRAIFHLIGEVRQMGADPNVWRPHMVQRLLKLFDAQIVVSSEVHFRKLGRGAMRLVDVGWGGDELGNKWQIQTERDDERPENYWLAARAPSAEEGDKP